MPPRPSAYVCTRCGFLQAGAPDTDGIALGTLAGDLYVLCSSYCQPELADFLGSAPDRSGGIAAPLQPSPGAGAAWGRSLPGSRGQ